jgi:DNA-directed RNA polymerase specialized sigma24 family protein
MAKDRTRDALAAHRAATRTLAGFWNIPATVREEYAQEATLRTLVAREVVDPSRYAARVAKRLAIDWLRRQDEALRPDVSDVQEVSDWQRRVEARMDLARVGAAIETAPRTHRETLVLLYVEEATLAEAVERRVAAEPGADPARERDRLYKRRTRALSWVRRLLAA